ncbi:Lysine-specific histone demethylase 1B [Nymphon striatum]|nr:Lysine-specific histone demethylase 1B [Nymphon striatum]
MKTESKREYSSRKRLKTKAFAGDTKVRKCEKGGCPSAKPVCFAFSCAKCAANTGNTSRWYHMSCGEHFCNDCFEHFYRPHKEGYRLYLEWRKQWVENSRSEPSIRAFMNDQVLPYWVQCFKPTCKKWRSIPNKYLNNCELESDFIKTFECSKLSGSCNKSQDSRVNEVYEDTWICQLMNTPLLRKSPASQFLKNYFPDGVGLSPLCSSSQKPVVITANNGVTTASKSAHLLSPVIQSPEVPGLNPHFQPFYQPSEHGKAMCVRPDVMEIDEEEAFPEFQKNQVMYLAIRNLIIALWNLDCKVWLTTENVSPFLICRGLARIRCLIKADRILQFLTSKGIINFGILKVPAENQFLKSCNESVIIIGAGVAGLAAAKQLSNFGLQVKILESQNRIGGRVHDDYTLGSCVGRGAQIVTGVINNPISYMCHQSDRNMRILGINCDLYDEKGKIIPPNMDSKMEMHFNAMLELVSMWRNKATEDVDLITKLNEMHEVLLKQDKIELLNKEHQILQFHISNLEYACGSSLSKISSINWDQNELLPQFAGSHSILPYGYSVLFEELADGLDIQFNSKVTKIDYTQNEVTVSTSANQSYQANKVIVTLPLAILQKNCVDFIPELPEEKNSAINSLGAGIIEKVILKFDRCFWKEKVQNADFFGVIPANLSDRGIFAIFYDLSSRQETEEKVQNEESSFFLMTYLSGDAVELTNTSSDEQIIELCMITLLGWIVSHWKTDEHAQMSYSYVKTNGSGRDYDVIAESVDDKLYFAGEATNRQFPQTVTGAFHSGLREAGKILNSLRQ